MQHQSTTHLRARTRLRHALSLIYLRWQRSVRMPETRVAKHIALANPQKAADRCSRCNQERADIMIVHVKFAGGLHSFTVDGSAKLPELAQLMKTVDAQLDAESVKLVGAKLSKSAVYPSRMPGTSLLDAGASRRQRCIPLQH